MSIELILSIITNIICLGIHLTMVKRIYARIGKEYEGIRDFKREININNLKIMAEASRKLQDYVAQYEESHKAEMKMMLRELEMAQASIEGIRNVNIKALEEDIIKIQNFVLGKYAQSDIAKGVKEFEELQKKAKKRQMPVKISDQEDGLEY